MKKHIKNTAIYRSLESFWRYRTLISGSVERDIKSRYQGSYIGVAWMFLTPLLTLIMFTFIFSVIFKAKWGLPNETKGEFALVLFAGLNVYLLIADNLQRSPSSMASNVNLVKKVIFPLEILPLITMLSSLYFWFVGMVIWLVIYIVIVGMPSPISLMLPVVIIPTLLGILGLNWVLAALGPYIRDLGQIVGLLTTALLYMSPIIYPINAVPEDYRFWINLNPITAAVDGVRDLLIWGRFPDITAVIYLWVLGLAMYWIGYRIFIALKRGFADVI